MGLRGRLAGLVMCAFGADYDSSLANPDPTPVTVLAMAQSTTDLSIDACITNGGGLRAPLPAGNVTNGDVLTLLPFGNTLVVKNMSGLAIISALENGVASNWAANEQRGAFSQVRCRACRHAMPCVCTRRVVPQVICGCAVDGGVCAPHEE